MTAQFIFIVSLVSGGLAGVVIHSSMDYRREVNLRRVMLHSFLARRLEKVPKDYVLYFMCGLIGGLSGGYCFNTLMAGLAWALFSVPKSNTS